MTTRRLDALVRDKFQLSWGKARDHIASGKIRVDGVTITDEARPTGETSAIELRMNAPRAATQAARWSGTAPKVVHQDSQVIVVSKPSGLNTVPYEKEPGPSLDRWSAERLGQPRVGIVQRLDRETSGLVVFARTSEAERLLANQFRFRQVHRRYLALVHGEPRDQTIRSILLDDRGDGLRGSWRAPPRGPARPPEGLGKEAVTHVRRLASWPGASLIECELESGRTHQIRIHLSEAGHPLLGERAYIREHAGPRVEAPRIMLHAAELGFIHPTRQAPMQWDEAPPEDFLGMLPPSARGTLKLAVARGPG